MATSTEALRDSAASGDDSPVGDGPNPRRKRGWIIAAVVGVVLILGAGGAVIALKVASDAAAAAVAEQTEKQQLQEQREQDREREADERERESREEAVADIEESVRAMAVEHAADDVIEGPILEVMCSPLGGGSMDDLTEKTTVFECFVANEDKGDGMMSGYTYNATMNWDTGQYTYGLGAP